MNERIRDLKEQALCWAVETLDPDALNDNEWGVAIYGKFAELIVKECAKVCRDQPNVYALKADRDNCAIAIEEHFGVEEK